MVSMKLISLFFANKQIKSVLIQLYARPDDAVLDLACGKVIVVKTILFVHCQFLKSGSNVLLLLSNRVVI